MKNWGAVFATSYQQTDARSQNFEKSARVINGFVENYSSLNYAMPIPDLINDSEANPSYSLTSAPINNDYRRSLFLDKLNAKIKLIDLSCADTEEHFRKYFKTDNHWNIIGAYEAYKQIMVTAFPDLSALDFSEDDLRAYEEPRFCGSSARLSLDDSVDGDTVLDYITYLPETRVFFDGEGVSFGEVEDVESYVNKDYDRNKLTVRYGEYFHYRHGVTTFESQNNTGRNLLIFSDSFVSCCDRFYAASFDTVVTVDEEYFAGSIREVMEENNITDVLFERNDSRYYGELSESFIHLLAS